MAIVLAGAATPYMVPPAVALAQEASSSRPGLPVAATPAEAASGDAQAGSLDVIVVTAAARPVARLDTSVSVSALDAKEVREGVPRTTAEILRHLPGVRAEATGGEGNANIAVRGLPVASGGAKFVQLQEDGLPVLQFGDIAFGNADIFLRADGNLASIQSVRGGSASTFASNAPGGIINLISKDGSRQGGQVRATLGLDYGEYRLDFDYGGALSDRTRFHLGGFWRQGEGVRRAGYDANRGYQIKANLTQEFDGGYLRAHFKRLDDRAAGYLPMPVAVSGTNADPRYRSLPGFDAGSDTLHSRLFTRDFGLNARNRQQDTDIRDGMHPVLTALGFELVAKPLAGWRVENRFRWTWAHGRFVGPFPAAVDSAGALASSVGELISGPGNYRAIHANGPLAGQEIDPASLAVRVHLFDVDIDDLGSVVNDFKLSRAWGPATVTAGYYRARQDIAMSWLWNSYLMELRGGGRAALLNVANADGSILTRNGLYAYGVPAWGQCCQRRYDVRYTIDAPYVSGTLELGRIALDASLRRDNLRARGSYAGTVEVANADVDGDGTIQPVERTVLMIDNASPYPVRYTVGYWSWSLGANLRIGEAAALFARASRGGRANADRLLFGRVRPDGSVLRANAVDFVNQYELGVKARLGRLDLFVTGFHARTQEQNYEATTQRTLDRTYEASGIELEGRLRTAILDLRAGATWTDARIARDAITPDNEGNRPRRQAKLIYQASAAADIGKGRAGINLLGTTASYAQDSNALVLPAFAQVNAFAQWQVLPATTLALAVNNLFDAHGFTEAEEGSIPANGIVRARSISGRTVSASLELTF